MTSPNSTPNSAGVPPVPVLIDPIHLDMITLSPFLSSRIGDSVIIYSWTYYRLTPVRYAKTRHMTSQAQEDYQAGNLSSIQWEAIRARFNAIHDAAVQHCGEDVLLTEFNRLLTALKQNLTQLKES